MIMLRMIVAELMHRRLHSTICLLGVALATSACVAFVLLLEAHEHRMSNDVRTLDDEIRKITKAMGFNILILPEGQSLADFYAEDFAHKSMPESYVDRLAESRDLITVRHLRPALVRKQNWPERNRKIILMGIRGVVPLAHRNKRRPLAEPVPPGTMHVGAEIARELSLKAGMKTVFMGRTFTVGKVFAARGSKDDITVWIDLRETQQLLGMAGRINMIQALECLCAAVDRLAGIQQEISGILGTQVQVVEIATKAIARAKARNTVKAEGLASIAHRRRLARILIPGAVLVAGLWIGLLMLANVRHRTSELGILSALGWSARAIVSLILGKAALIGLAGALVALIAGWLVARLFDVGAPGPGALVLETLLLTVAVSLIAAWLPAQAAAAVDPARALRTD